ncbi:MAG: glycerate kinase [Bacteroidales bacterium]|nr:glycerate kinase [Bacteroidales bacterium]
MKLLIAPDSFKGTLSAVEICNLFLKEIKGLDIAAIPLSDGGEGALQSIIHTSNFERIELQVFNPLFQEISAYYLFDKKQKTAYVELAVASGIALLKQTDIMNASTCGTGQLVVNALEKGAEKVVLFVGGSSSNDAGLGIAAALGIRFYDGRGETVRPTAKNLTRILKIDRSHSLLSKYNAKLLIAVDVNNPFYGKTGAAYVYAAQKGASNAQILFLDEALKHIANIFYWKYGIDVQKIKGSGAAGGVAGGLTALFNAEIIDASNLIFSLLKLDEYIKNADIIISGEGKIDKQSLNGKLLVKLAGLVKKYEKKLWVICGYFDGNNQLKQALNIDKIFALAKNTDELPEAISAPKERLKKVINELLIEFLEL